MRPTPRGPRGWLAAAEGAAAAEFALVLPLMLLILFGVMSLGLALYTYEMLTGGVRVGVRQFAISRGSSTPFTDAQKAVRIATTPALNFNSLTLGFLVAPPGTSVFVQCSTDTSCASALVSGATAEVNASYPCTIVVMSIKISGCQLTQSTQELVE